MPDWIDREYDRFDTGEYCGVNLILNDTVFNLSYLSRDSRLHFVHVDPDDHNLVRYTPNSKYGELDRKVSVKLGRYLTKFYSDMLTSQQIADLVAYYSWQNEPPVLHMAVSEEEMVWVYRHGPSSCMSKDTSVLSSSPIHPVSVYASGDIGLAYLLNHDGTRASARTLVNLKKKLYTRVYGDEIRLLNVLKANDYEYEAKALKGCRLKLVRPVGTINKLVMPYLDRGAVPFLTTNQDIVIGDRYETPQGCIRLNPHSTSGVVSIPRTCRSCGASDRDREFYDDNDVLCLKCRLDEGSLFKCRSCNNSYLQGSRADTQAACCVNCAYMCRLCETLKAPHRSQRYRVYDIPSDCYLSVCEACYDYVYAHIPPTGDSVLSCNFHALHEEYHHAKA
jgi:hypothetical protein